MSPVLLIALGEQRLSETQASRHLLLTRVWGRVVWSKRLRWKQDVIGAPEQATSEGKRRLWNFWGIFLYLVLSSASPSISKWTHRLPWSVLATVPWGQCPWDPSLVSSALLSCPHGACLDRTTDNWHEREMTTHSSVLAWEIPWIEEPGGLQSMGSQKSRTWLSDLTTTADEWGWRGEELTVTLAGASSSPSSSSPGDRHGWMAAWMEHSVTHLSPFSPAVCKIFSFFLRGTVSLLILKTATCEERGCSLTTLHHWSL